MRNILIVDDEVGARESLRMILKNEYEVFLAKNAEEAFLRIKEHSPDVILLDIILPDLDGLKVLEIIKQNDPDAIVIMITATKTVKTAVEAMKLGAYDYVTKPFEVDELRLMISRALSTQALEKEVQYLRKEVDKNFGFGNIIGKSEIMKEIFNVIRQIADSAPPASITSASPSISAPRRARWASARWRTSARSTTGTNTKSPRASSSSRCSASIRCRRRRT